MNPTTDRLAEIAGQVREQLKDQDIARGGLVAGGVVAALALVGTVWRAFSRKAARIPVISSEDEDEADWVRIEETIRVECSPKRAYRFWRDVENLQEHMRNVVEVEPDGGLLHWRQRAPGGLASAEWDARLTEDKKNRRIGWKSTPESQVPTAGFVHFERLKGTNATSMTFIAEFKPPAGAIGRFFGGMMAPVLEQQIKGDLRRIKEILESPAQ